MARAGGKWHNPFYLQASNGMQIEASRQCKRCIKVRLNCLQVKVVVSAVSAQEVESRKRHCGGNNVLGMHLADRKARISL
jgi:hypothetical protein